jgi:hypothetical protein
MIAGRSANTKFMLGLDFRNLLEQGELEHYVYTFEHDMQKTGIFNKNQYPSVFICVYLWLGIHTVVQKCNVSN